MAAHVRPSANTLATRVGEEIILVHLKTDKIFVLNRTGARVWELISEDLDLDAMGQRIAREFDVATQAVSVEIGELFDALRRDDLVILEEEHPSTR
jgi:hypothetical protein